MTHRYLCRTSLCNIFMSRVLSGLAMSQLDAISIHFICALHVKWIVRRHVCGTAGIFGKKASEMWSNLMQWAEGPEGFEDGYLKMTKHFLNDPDRLQYVKELYEDDDKVLFKTDFTFSNGVVIDVCEQLISALRTWVQGSSRRGVSLFLTVVRIVKGTRRLIMRSFLKPVRETLRDTVRKSSNFAVVTLFKFLSYKVTSWAVKVMYKVQDAAGMSVWNVQLSVP